MKIFDEILKIYGKNKIIYRSTYQTKRGTKCHFERKRTTNMATDVTFHLFPYLVLPTANLELNTKTTAGRF